MTKIKIEEAARMLGVTPQFVRIGLQRGALTFGTAFKTHDKSNKYSYIIYPEKLKECAGEERYREVMGDVDKARDTELTR